MGVHIHDNKLVIIETKTFYFHFYFLKDVEKNLKHEIDHIIKHNGFLADQRTKNENEQLLYKYNHGNDIHKHQKQ